MTAENKRHNIALALQKDLNGAAGLGSVVFGLWTTSLTELPPHKLFERRVGIVEAFLDGADVEFRGGGADATDVGDF